MKVITLKNAWSNRDEVVQRCIEKKACKDEFDKLMICVNESNREEYLNILRNNFDWCIRNKILQYQFDYCDYFVNGFSRVLLNKKWGYIKENGTYLIEPKFDGCSRFTVGRGRNKIISAETRIGDEIKRINTKGKYI